MSNTFWFCVIVVSVTLWFGGYSSCPWNKECPCSGLQWNSTYLQWNGTGVQLNTSRWNSPMWNNSMWNSVCFDIWHNGCDSDCIDGCRMYWRCWCGYNGYTYWYYNGDWCIDYINNYLNDYCNISCRNGGTFNNSDGRCDCPERYTGDCCQHSKYDFVIR